MTEEIRLLAFSAALGFAHVVAASAAGLGQRGGLTWAAGNRESGGQVTGAAARLDRASKNFFETFPLFAALVLAAAVSGRQGGAVAWGAELYFWGRLLYLPVYGFGVPWIRTLVWGVAIAGIGFVFAGLFGWAGPGSP